MFVLFLIAKFDLLPKCISTFRTTRKPPPNMTRFVLGKGFVRFEGYSAEDVKKVLAETLEIHIEDVKEDQE